MFYEHDFIVNAARCLRVRRKMLETWRHAYLSSHRANIAHFTMTLRMAGYDILGSFPKAVEQVKYLVVMVDYSTKWIEAESLTKITTNKMLCFSKRNILAWFGVPTFTNRKFQEYLKNLKIKHNFTPFPIINSSIPPPYKNCIGSHLLISGAVCGKLQAILVFYLQKTKAFKL